MGLQCGYMQKSFDVSNITWDNQFNGYQYDPTLPSGEMNFMEKTGFFDMSAGVAYKYFSTETNLYNIERTSFDGGIAFFHLTRGKQEFFQGQQDRLYGRLVVHATSLFTLENRPEAYQDEVIQNLLKSYIIIIYHTFLLFLAASIPASKGGSQTIFVPQSRRAISEDVPAIFIDYPCKSMIKT